MDICEIAEKRFPFQKEIMYAKLCCSFSLLEPIPKEAALLD